MNGNRKKLFFTLFALMTILTGLSANAILQQKASKTSRSATQKTEKESVKCTSTNYSEFAATTSKAFVKPMGVAKAEETSGVTIYGSVVYSENISSTSKYGIYSFPAQEGTTITSVKLGKTLRANGGGAYVNGKYYYVYYLDTNLGIGYPYFYSYDVDNGWDKLDGIKNTDLSYAGTSMTYDDQTNTLYAIAFTDDSRTGTLWLSTVNMETGKITHISAIDPMAFIAADNNGQLFGVKYSDGGLYKINKKNGETTLVGLTGVTPKHLQSGTFDPNTGKLYWCAFTAESNSALYEINTTTGAASLISAMPGNEEVVGMFIPKNIADDAPGEATDFASTVNGSTCDVTFKAPTETKSGDDLSGTMTLNVYCNGTLIKQLQNVEAGTNCSVSNIAIVDGNNYVKAVATNAAGEGKAAGINVWSGADMPNAVENVKITSNGANQVTLTWNTPSGAHGGTIDKSDLKYRIVRNTIVDDKITSSTVVETAYADTTYTADMGCTTPVMYSFSVVPCSSVGEGDASTSDSHYFFSPMAIPFSETFDTPDRLKTMVIINSNNDEEGVWEYDSDKKLRYHFNNDEDADDWAFTPALQLEKGKTYKVSFDTWIESEDFPEKLAVTFGKSVDIKAQTVLMNTTELTNIEATRIELYIDADETGPYNVGFHALSDAGAYYMYVDNLTVEESASTKAPDVVTNLTASPGAKGALCDTISFKTPTLTLAKTPLTELTKVNIYRKGTDTPIASIDETEMGKTLQYIDNNAVQGVNTYYIEAENSFGVGLKDSVDVYVGIGIPLPVTLAKLEEDNGKGVATWNAVTGAVDNNYLDLSTVTYTVVRNDGVVVAKNISDTTLTDASINATESQKMVYYKIYPSSSAGTGNAATTNYIVFGAPYVPDYTESFANAKVGKGPWISESISGKASWAIVSKGADPSIEAQDADGGLLEFNSYDEKGESRIIMPKLDFSSMKNPQLTFWFYHYKGEDSVKVEAKIPGGEYKVIGEGYGNKQTSAAKEWVKYTVALTEFAGQPNVSLAFHGISAYDNNIHIDNVAVTDYLEHDLSATISGGGTASTGDTKAFSVNVKNLGATACDNYKVYLYCNDEKVDSLAGTNIDSKSETDFEFSVKYGPKDNGHTYSYHAVVDYADDQKLANNTTEKVSVEVSAPNYPAPTNLSGTFSSNNVELTWTAPEAAQPEAVADDVENYEAFAINAIGDWTMVDGDKGQPYFLSDVNGRALTYPNDNEPRAFQVFNQSMVANASLDTCLNPHSGQQYFIAIASQKVQNNDWMISPKVQPATKVKFYAKALSKDYAENFKVMYSKTGTDVADFVELSNGEVTASASWQQYEYTLPADAKYFAINYVSNDAFALMIDDIEYTKAPVELTLLGYNVYRNDQMINTTGLVNETSFVDAISDSDAKDAVYTVTAVYDKGESAYSNEATVEIEISNVTDIQATSKAKVYAADHMIHILNVAEGTPVEIYSVNGVCLYSGTKHQVPVSAQGLYLVKAGNSVYKVIAK